MSLFKKLHKVQFLTQSKRKYDDNESWQQRKGALLQVNFKNTKRKGKIFIIEFMYSSTVPYDV